MSKESLEIPFEDDYSVNFNFDDNYNEKIYTELDRFRYSKNNFNTFFSQGD